MFVLFLLLNELFDLFTSRAFRITSVQHLDNNIGRVDYFVEFIPDASALAGFEQREHCFVCHAFVIHD